MKLYSKIFLGLSLVTVAHATPTNGEKLFNAKCSACHISTFPKDKSKLIAPPLMGVMRHVKMSYSTKDKAVDFIVDYALNPTAQKAVCMPMKIKRFGLMPSQKGSVSEEELREIASWMFDNFPKNGMNMHKGEKGKNCSASTKSKKSQPPFLIKSPNLPHMTKLIMQNWDNADLNLTKEQKEKLLVIRKETMGGVKKIKQAIQPLESEIVNFDNNLTKIAPKVKEVAKLKADATLLHLKCIKNTKEVLSEKQLEMLLK